jgi:hypothetical protein
MAGTHPVLLRQLFDCAQRGDVVQVQALLAVLPSRETYTANRALTAAVRNDHASVVAAFAAARIPASRLPMHLDLAVCHGSVHVAAFLIQAKVSVDGDFHREPPLYTATSRGQLLGVSLLVAVKARLWGAGSRYSALHRAAQCGHADVVECLLRAKADHRQPNSINETPVYLAAIHKGSEPALRVLLDAHADVNPPPPCVIPLTGAACYARLPSVFHVLLGARADVNATLYRGYTALLAAVTQKCSDAVVKLLVRAKADVNVQCATGEGRAPLHAAAMCGRLTTARLLVRAKADTRAETLHGQTAAAIALRNRHFKLADYLDAHART